MSKPTLGSWGVLVATLCTAITTYAQVMAQDPLFARTASVEPNIVFVFDDSGSMTARHLYQFGGGSGGYGKGGPDNISQSGTAFDAVPTTVAGQSPDVNRIYYDPRTSYKRRINVDGTPKAAGSTAGIVSFPVYFYKPPITNFYSVASVSISGGGTGYPATGVTARFANAPFGGVTALATVTTAPTGIVDSVTLTNRGANYPATGVTATFSAPSAGGIQATATVTTATTNKVNSVTSTAFGSGYPSSGVTATFAPPAAGGVTATGTPVIAARSTAASIGVTNPGTGYTSAPTITFSAPPTGGVRALGTVTTGTFYKVASVGVSGGGGAGYTNGSQAITFSAPSAGGTRATANATVSGGKITSVTVTNAGIGYTSVPTIVSIAGAIPTTAATLTINAPPLTGVSGVTITNPGSGYTAIPTASLSGGGGTGAVLTAVTPGTSNVITGITITNGGSGYASAPAVTISAASGSGAVMTPVLANTGRWISSINMTNKGAGYSSPPTLTLGGTGTTGAGATWNIVTGTTNAISAVNVTRAGSGYFGAPALTITASVGSGATFTVNTNATSTGVVNRIWDGNPSNPNPNTSASYFTPSYLPDAGSTLAAGADATRAYPNTASAATSFYPKFLDRTDCTSTTGVCTWAEEVQNYANWLTYHARRVDLAKTGIGIAFQPLNPTFRLGWATINDATTNNRLVAGVQLFNTTTKTAFLNWLYGLNTPSGTPNRAAIDTVGRYYQRDDDNGPWATSPPAGPATANKTGSDVITHASCRRAYALLMTDGYYNESFTLPDVDSTIGTTISTPAAYTYTPIGPYSDKIDGTSWSNTFADVAMKYWGTDLRPTIPNKIKATANDPAYWQHMNFYAIGLGVIGELDATSDQLRADLTGDASTVPPRVMDWPNPGGGNSPKAIDDMWHATINGRGKIYNAKTTLELTNAIGQMLSDVAGAEGTQAGVAVSTATLSSDTKKYTPSYTPITWEGNLTAYDLNSNAIQKDTPAWQVETLVSTNATTGYKTYSSIIPAAPYRNIYVGNGATAGTRAVEFKYTSLPAGISSKMTGTVSQSLVDYLRGDNADEDTATTTTALYRYRTTRLGDIVNSTPVFIKNSVDLNYQLLPNTIQGGASYRAFVDGAGTVPAGGKKQRGEGMLVVGANDGMLHAFRDGTKDSLGNVINPGGIETFAYIPNALLPSLRKLADKAYVHQYYVDGPLSETDAYLPVAGRWANVVLGSTGGGAGVAASNGVSPRTGVFAIDMTTLNSGTTGFTASNVLWEVGSDVTGFEEVGYVLVEPEAGPTVSGDWVAIFGNGYESKSCRAQLFVVNVETGALIKKIDTGVGSGNCADKTNTNRNGLGGVRVVRDSNKQIIGAYAGDLQGNMWKFDLSAASSTNWKVDLAGVPMFTAGPAKPITAAPSVIGLTASSSPAGGYMVAMGTGKFFEVDDISSTNVQSLYGIWDPVPFGTGVSTTALTSTSRLVPQTISAGTTTSTGTYFTVGNAALDYTSSVPNRGWYINLPNSGQRMVYPFEVVRNRFLIADTISPANVSLDPCAQNSAGTGYLYAIDALTGAGIQQPIFDTNGDGNIDSNDLTASGIQTSADGRNRTIGGSNTSSGGGSARQDDGSGTGAVSYEDANKYICQAGSPACTKTKFDCSLDGTCTPAVVPGAAVIDTREWRQLFMR